MKQLNAAAAGRLPDGELATQLEGALAPGAHLRLFLPTLDRHGRRLPLRQLYSQVEARVLPLARGVTVTAGIGVWISGAGPPVRESVVILETYLPGDLTPDWISGIAAFLLDLPDQAKQEAVAVAVNGRLYVLPSTNTGDNL